MLETAKNGFGREDPRFQRWDWDYLVRIEFIEN